MDFETLLVFVVILLVVGLILWGTAVVRRWWGDRQDSIRQAWTQPTGASENRSATRNGQARSTGDSRDRAGAGGVGAPGTRNGQARGAGDSSDRAGTGGVGVSGARNGQARGAGDSRDRAGIGGVGSSSRAHDELDLAALSSERVSIHGERDPGRGQGQPTSAAGGTRAASAPSGGRGESAADSSTREEIYQIRAAIYRLEDMLRLVQGDLQFLRRGDQQRTTPSAVAPPPPQPITLDDLLQFWNEEAEWTNPDESLRRLGSRIIKDGWWISEELRKRYRVVGKMGATRFFLFPYLRRDVRQYQEDFFDRPAAGDSKELRKPAVVELAQPGANIKSEIERLQSDDAPLTDVFRVHSKGAIV